MSEDSIFGSLAQKKFSIGDMVCWSELAMIGKLYTPNKEKRFGIISSIDTVSRGDRKVVLAKIITVQEPLVMKEILVVCLTMISKASNKEV